MNYENGNNLLFLSELLYQAIDGVYEGRDKEILLRRFGLCEGGPQTLREVGLSQGLSHERVRQLEQKIIHKLRAAWKTTIRLPAYHVSAVNLKEALDSFLKADQEGFKERLRELLESEFADLNPDLVKLLVDVAYRPNFRPKVLRTIKERKPPKEETHVISRIEGLVEHFIWPANCVFNCADIATKYTNPVREMGRTSLGNTGSYFSEKLQREILCCPPLSRPLFEYDGNFLNLN